MKKNILWISVLVIIVVIITIISKNKKAADEINNIPLQEKYAGYQEINNQYQSDIFQVKLLCESYLRTPSTIYPIAIFPSLNNHLIVECDVATDEVSRFNTDYYKIDEYGEVQDIFKYKFDQYWPNFINEFIVFTNSKGGYYTTWPLDGDVTKHKMTELNSDFSWTDSTVDKEIVKIKDESSYYFIEYDNVTKYTQHFFYQDNKWQILWQKTLGYKQYTDDEKVYRYRHDLFQTGHPNSYFSENIKFLHFYPEEKMKYFHAAGSLNGGGHAKYNWRGKGFFQTKIGYDKFYFLIPKLVVERERHDGWKNRFYTVEKKKSAVTILQNSFFSNNKNFAFYSDTAKKLYIIRKKNKREN